MKIKNDIKLKIIDIRFSQNYNLTKCRQTKEKTTHISMLCRHSHYLSCIHGILVTNQHTGQIACR